MSKIIAFRAIYGHQLHTHALLAQTPDCDVFTSLASIESDLPAESPAGIIWKPFFRGWVFKDHYLFSLTQPDPAATRPGMVRTQILAIPVGQVQRIKSLIAAFRQLRLQWDEKAVLLPAVIESEAVHKEENRPPPSPLLLRMGQRLAVGVPDDSPVVVCGEEEFPTFVSELWGRMPPPFRRELIFGFTFTPTDLKQRGLHLACCPTALAERWRGYSGFLRSEETGQAVSRACGYLLGLPEGREIEKFIREAELDYPSPKTLPAYERAATDWANRNNLDFDSLCSLARDLVQLAPDTSQAARIKSQVAAQLAEKIRRGRSDCVMPLRNLRMSVFGAAAVPVENAVTEWTAAHLLAGSDATDEDLVIVLNALSRPVSEEWREWVSKGIHKALATMTEGVARSVWSLWGRDEGLFEIFAGVIPADSKNETTWAKTTPAKLTRSVGAKVATWARKRDWWLLHAKALVASNPWESAARLHLKELPQFGELASVRMMLEASPIEPAVLFAAKENDSRLHQCAAELCGSNPEVFAGFDAKQLGWQEILRLTIASNAHFLRSLPNSRAVLFSLVDALLGLEIIIPESELFATFVHEGCADLSAHPRRGAALTALPASVREGFLSDTAAGWLASFFNSPKVTSELEPELRVKIFGSQLRGKRFPKTCQSLVSSGLILFQKFQEATEEGFTEWLDTVASSACKLSSNDAEKIASVLKHRGWETAALRLKTLGERYGRGDMAQAWESYWRSLGKLDRLLFRVLGPIGSTSTSRSGHGSRSMHMDSQKTTALFVTALGSEFEALCSHLRHVEEKKHKGTIYSVGQFQIAETCYEVVVVQTGMGNSKSAVETERAIELFAPQYAFFVGIAGGLKDDLQLGDVVAADKVYGYEAGKAANSFRPRPEAPWVSHEAVQRAQVVARERNWIKRIAPTPRNPPNAFVKPIAAGEKVIDSHRSEIYKFIQQSYGDAYAVAMEELGFAYAAHANKGVTFAVVRGISDFATGKAAAEKENSQRTAAIHAAAFAIEMLAGLIGKSNSGPPQLETSLL